MRVTNKMLVNTVLQNLNRNLSMLHRSQDQMSSGKVVSRPSDDPIRVTQALTIRSALMEQKQHTKNMKDAKSWLDSSDTALDNVNEILQRARELAVYGANGTLPKQSREAIAQEVDQLIDHLVQVANSSYAGRFVFAGTRTTDIPFQRVGDSVVYAGNDESLEWEVSPGVTIGINLDGEKAFDVAGGISRTFDVMIALKIALEEDKTDDIQSTIGDIQEQIDHNLSQRAVLGAKSRRMELAITRAEESQVNVTELLSKLEDIDLAEVTMHYSIQSYVYQVALMTGAKVMQPSLMDFLR
ncbi:MAG TPA: flagellar hook-associated protein FlgL [Clostridia bacterium]|nr:flagellar hook-associated protein FlgL [Clostridia bacterium]